MNPLLLSAVVLFVLILAVFLGRWLRQILPDHHLSSDSKDAIKLAMGLVGTMAALLLGLLISAARDSYNADRSQVIQMSAKISFLNRVLHLYGPDADGVRAQFRATVEDGIARLWPGEKHQRAELTPSQEPGNSVFFAIEALPAKSEIQQKIKAIAETTATELGQQRSVLVAQADSSVSPLMLAVVVCWLIVIFVSFSILAPPNLTATVALLVSTLAVSGAILLILELDQPFDGIISIPSHQMRNALNELSK